MNRFLSTTGQCVMLAMQGVNGRWSVEQVLDGYEINCLAADPLRPEVIYAGAKSAGILFSADSGRSWSTAGLEGKVIKAIAASRLIPGLVFAGTKPACLFVSRDGGQKWEELTAFRKIPSRFLWFSPAEKPFSAYVQGIALSPSDPDTLLVGIEAGAVVRSADGGKTWQDHRPGALRDCHSITFHSSNGAWAYEAGGTGAGVSISQDGGSSWKQARAGLDRHYGWACAADSEKPEIMYVSMSPSPFKAHGDVDAQAYIYRSTRDGIWQKLSGGLPQPLNAMPYSILTDPGEPGCIYTGLSNGDVWRSADRGDSWERLPLNMKSIRRQMIMLE